MSDSDKLQKSREERLEIDRAALKPVGMFIGTSIVWLLIGSFLAIGASIKLHDPSFLGESEWLTFGRVRPAHLNTVAYGWLSSACIGIGLWILSRLCRVPITDHASLTLAAVIWNIGNIIGTVGILAGKGTSIEWLEYPPYAAPFLLVSFAFVMMTSLSLIRRRQPGHVYVSQWYIMAAFFWFPLLYLTSETLLVWTPVTTPAQAAINWWFAHNALGLWFGPIALAAIYYLLPKVIGKPIHSYYLSMISFWALAFFYAWAGMHHLIGGPYPAWVISAGVVASIMMFIPVISVAINQHFTLKGNFSVLRWSPTLRFIVFGGMSYTLVSVQGSLMAIRSINYVTHFTHYTVAHAHLGAYAFSSMVFFGAIYYMMPRLLEREWPSARLISLHFWCCSIGITVYFIALTIGGWYQGKELNMEETPFLEIVKLTIPYLKARSWGGALMTLGHVFFAISFVWMLVTKHQSNSTGTLLGKKGPVCHWLFTHLLFIVDWIGRLTRIHCRAIKVYC